MDDIPVLAAILTLPAAILIVGLVALLARPKEGGLPAVKIGDQWVYDAVNDDGERYKATWTVTGEDAEGKEDSFIVQVSFVPPLSGPTGDIETAQARMDKTSHLLVEMQIGGEVGGEPAMILQQVSYEFSPVSLWPLEAGKEVAVAETTTITSWVGSQKPEAETEAKASIYKVESVEGITVKAGTFECYRIEEYDQNGERLSTKWHSDKVKTDVKTADYKTGETTELISYSVR